VGAESFAGEKERKTLEALFYTPASDRELFIAKILAAFILAVGLAWLSFVLYGVVLNLLGYPVMGQLWFPTLVWYPLMLWVVPAVSLLGVAGSVIISSRVSTFMDAYQASAALVIPVILILIGQFAGVLYLTVELILLFGLIIWIIDFVLIAVGIRLFSRSQMMAHL
jgi:ABC-2 type transport system permease protein